MEVNSPHSKPITPQELEYLDQLKKVVRKSLEDGKFSIYEADRIKSMIRAEGKITYARLITFRKTVKEVMSNIEPEIEWRSNQ
ncbi:MAG: hypothetical protein AAFV28_01870 [Cyanobacteria bacterium J06635_13]